jgi:hypothetical protein
MGTYALTFNHDEVVRLLKAAVEREEVNSLTPSVTGLTAFT